MNRIINCLEIILPNTHGAVFDKASYFEHSCCANCSITNPDAGGILIKAAKPIAKGDHLSIAYTDTLTSTVERRYRLSTTKFFDCNCERCSDPTDLGTMSNAIKCTAGNCTGYMLPKTFLLPNGECGDFFCHKCNESKSWIEVKNMQESISVKLNSVDKSNVDECRRFIEDHMKLLHENHHYMLLAKTAFVDAIGRSVSTNPSTVSTELWTEGITLCKQLEIISKTLVPGHIKMRGHTSFVKSILLLAKYQTFDLTVSPEEAIKALTETCDLLRDEPRCTEPGRLVNLARSLLDQFISGYND